MVTKFALTLEFKKGGTVLFTHVVQADASFPLPPKGDKFVLHHADITGVLKEYVGEVSEHRIEISSNAASGISIVNQLVTLINSSSKAKP
jgi:hypothetical protein